jgi:hypothetical protein
VDVDSGNGYSYSFTTTDWDQDTWDRVFGTKCHVSPVGTKFPHDGDGSKATLNEVRDLLVEIRDELKKDRQVVNHTTYYYPQAESPTATDPIANLAAFL